jgi:hypothetical protein
MQIMLYHMKIQKAVTNVQSLHFIQKYSDKHISGL